MREYCCCKCGLIWMEGKKNKSLIICPECENTYKNSYYGIFETKTMSWEYLRNDVVIDLARRSRNIHQR